MFGKKKMKRDVKMPPHLSPKEQKQIKAVVEAARKDNGVPRTAQQSIPFQRMFPDGICRVRDNYYTQRQSGFRILTISWLSRRIKQRFLKSGVDS